MVANELWPRSVLWLTIVWAIASFLAVTSEAKAQASDAQARAAVHVQSAANHFQRGRYQRAIEEYETAYALVSHGALLLSVASVAERAGSWRQRLSALRRYQLTHGELPAELAQAMSRLQARQNAQTGRLLPPGRPAPGGQTPEDSSQSALASSQVEPSAVGSRRESTFLFLAAGAAAVAMGAFVVVNRLQAGREESCAARCSGFDRVRLLRSRRGAIASGALALTLAVAGIVVRVQLD